MGPRPARVWWSRRRHLPPDRNRPRRDIPGRNIRPRLGSCSQHLNAGRRRSAEEPWIDARGGREWLGRLTSVKHAHLILGSQQDFKSISIECCLPVDRNQAAQPCA